jgi:hypothetical protein
LNIRLYPVLKNLKLVTLEKIGTAHAATIKQFSVDTGQEIAPETESLEVKHLEARCTDLRSEIEAYELLITDIKSLP